MQLGTDRKEVEEENKFLSSWMTHAEVSHWHHEWCTQTSHLGAQMKLHVTSWSSHLNYQYWITNMVIPLLWWIFELKFYLITRERVAQKDKVCILFWPSLYFRYFTHKKGQPSSQRLTLRPLQHSSQFMIISEIIWANCPAGCLVLSLTKINTKVNAQPR